MFDVQRYNGVPAAQTEVGTNCLPVRRLPSSSCSLFGPIAKGASGATKVHGE